MSNTFWYFLHITVVPSLNHVTSMIASCLSYVTVQSDNSYFFCMQKGRELVSCGVAERSLSRCRCPHCRQLLTQHEPSQLLLNTSYCYQCLKLILCFLGCGATIFKFLTRFSHDNEIVPTIVESNALETSLIIALSNFFFTFTTNLKISPGNKLMRFPMSPLRAVAVIMNVRSCDGMEAIVYRASYLGDLYHFTCVHVAVLMYNNINNM